APRGVPDISRLSLDPSRSANGRTTAGPPYRAAGRPRSADENSRARSPGFAAAPHPNQRWRARPGPRQIGPRVSASWNELYAEGSGHQGSESNRLKGSERADIRINA